jgi:hypothetical protein
VTSMTMSERELQSAVIDLARRCGFLYMHITDSRKSAAVGFPDLVLVHKTTGRAIYAELKSAKGRLRPEQHEWINALCRGAHEAVIWRPEDWQSGAIQAALLSERKAA